MEQTRTERLVGSEMTGQKTKSLCLPIGQVLQARDWLRRPRNKSWNQGAQLYNLLWIGHFKRSKLGEQVNK